MIMTTGIITTITASPMNSGTATPAPTAVAVLLDVVLLDVVLLDVVLLDVVLLG